MSPDSRRAERRTLLLDTALELLSSEGWSATSVRSVCQAARLNPRYFYESFETLDDLLVAVYDRVVEELTAAVTDAVLRAGPSVRDQLRSAIDAILRYVDEDRRRGRILYVVALGNETLNRRRLETGMRLVELVERDATSRVEVAPGEQVGRMGAAIVVGGFGELLAEWLAGRIEVDRRQLAEDATTLFLSLAEAASGIVARRSRRRPA
jgi:AcrR family transcriptional regulator